MSELVSTLCNLALFVQQIGGTGAHKFRKVPFKFPKFLNLKAT